MPLSSKTREEISELLISAVRKKLLSYSPETKHKPFHHRLIGEDRMKMFSFIHSLSGTLGSSIWEQVSVALAKATGYFAKRQYKLLGEIDGVTEKLINKIYFNLRRDTLRANKADEIEKIREAIKRGDAKKDPDSVVDLFLKKRDEEDYFDITSAKPNMKEFVSLKLKLLRWTALRFSQNRNAKVLTRLAIPYNPYHPKPYKRWTQKELYDLEEGEILVGKDFWNFVAGDNIYEDLLDVFEETGIELKKEIDEKFAEFQSSDVE